MFQFPKKQKLCSEKEIEKLFVSSNFIVERPLKVIWILKKNTDDVSVKTLVVVSKKKIKLAVERNFIKRRIKESYRLHKNKLEAFLKTHKCQLNLAIIYQHNKKLDYKTIDMKINLLVNRLIKKL